MTDEPSTEKATVTLPAVVEKVIKPSYSREPEKAQIAIEGADPLYREIRIENALTNVNGDQVRLKPGTQLEVTVQADSKDVVESGSPETTR